MNGRCKGYCGQACIDGTCPMANRDKYMERGYDVVWSCNECYYYQGCEDCYFGKGGATEYCDKNIVNKEN